MKRVILGFGAFGLIFAGIGSSVYATAGTTHVDQINITVPASCRMDAVSPPGTTHSETAAPGSLTSAIDGALLKVVCNDAGGFAIYTMGYSNDEYGNTEMITDAANPGQSGTATGNIITGTSTSGGTSNWMMRATKVNDSTAYEPNNLTITNSFSNWHVVPHDLTKMASYSSVTDSGDYAKGSRVQTAYRVWVSLNQAPATYEGQVLYRLIHPSNNASDPIKIMQEVADWKSSLSTGQTIDALDNRDGKIYKVAKLADGNVWMTQNLDFDIVNGGANLNSTNTDVPSNWADAGNLINTSNNWTGYTNLPESADPGNLCWDGVIQQYSGDLISCDQNGNHYHIGNYYNWTAAVAMANSSSYIADGASANQSICPAGWTLPKSGSNTSGSFAYLVSQASLTAGTSGNIHQSPYYFIYSGLWGYNEVKMTDVVGLYQSSVVSSNYENYTLNIQYSGGLNPNQDLMGRDGGYPVRCVAR